MGNSLERKLRTKFVVKDEHKHEKTPLHEDMTTQNNAKLDQIIQDETDLQHKTADGTDELDNRAADVDISKYTYSFENLVFEGGGAKALAYCGAIQVLEEVNVMRNVKRFAGTSAGAITAALLAVDFTAEDIRQFMDVDIKDVLLDHSFGLLSLLPNLTRNYGWNPGKGILKWLGEQLKRQTGDENITFATVYKKYGKELCIVATNVNMMTAEYFHPKTTPNLSIRDAVRMSIAIPGLFQPCNLNDGDQVTTYVDGGVLCNYPISCYDGWWLSMEPEDSFLKRMYQLDALPRLFEKKERFGTYNDKTLGFLLYADHDTDLLRDNLEKRKGTGRGVFPHTALRNKYRKKEEERESRITNMKQYRRALEEFLSALSKHNTDGNDTINQAELTNALNDLPDNHKKMLFKNPENAMEELDTNGDGEIHYYEIDSFLERVSGHSLQSIFLGYRRLKNFESCFDFAKALESCVRHNAQRLFVEDRDSERTVGINTGYIDTIDFNLEQGDKDYIVQQGRKSTEVFLRYYVAENRLPKNSPNETYPSNDSITHAQTEVLGQATSSCVYHLY